MVLTQERVLAKYVKQELMLIKKKMINMAVLSVHLVLKELIEILQVEKIEMSVWTAKMDMWLRILAQKYVLFVKKGNIPILLSMMANRIQGQNAQIVLKVVMVLMKKELEKT